MFEERYKKLMVIPITLFIFAIISIKFVGIEKSFDFTGGTSIRVDIRGKDIDVKYVEDTISKRFGAQVKIKIGADREWMEVDVPVINREITQEFAQENLREFGEVKSIEKSGPVISRYFWKLAIRALAIALIFMAIVVFITFRDPIPSFAVVLAAISDIVITMGMMAVLKIEFSLATFAALLMLIGYSVDTDILLTTRVLKRKGSATVDDRIHDAMVTGLTMSGTTLVALLVMWTSSYIFKIPVVASIVSVLTIGLLVDIINTWIQNAGILKFYVNTERGRRKWRR